MIFFKKIPQKPGFEKTRVEEEVPEVVRIQRLILGGEVLLDVKATEHHNEKLALEERQAQLTQKISLSSEEERELKDIPKKLLRCDLLIKALKDNTPSFIPITEEVTDETLRKVLAQDLILPGVQDSKRKESTRECIREALKKRKGLRDKAYLVEQRERGAEEVDQATKNLLQELAQVNPHAVDPETAQTFIKRITEALSTTQDEDSRNVLTSYFGEFLDSARL